MDTPNTIGEHHDSHHMYSREEKASSLLKTDCEKHQRWECRHGLSRSTSTRISSWKRFQAWKHVSAIFWKSHQNDELRATSSEKKVHFHPNADGEKYIRKFDDPVKNFKPQSEEEHEFHNQVLYVQELLNILSIFKISRSMLRLGANLRATVCGLHLGIQRITKTSEGWRWIKAFQGRKIWYNPYKDTWKRWSIAKTHTTCKFCSFRTQFDGQELLTLMSDPAKLVKMKVHPTIGQHNQRTYGTNIDVSKIKLGRPRSAFHLARTTKCFYLSSKFKNIWTRKIRHQRRRTIDWTRPLHKPRMVMYSQSYCTDHDCIHCFQSLTSSRRKFGISSKLQWRDYFVDNMPANALHWVVTCAREVLLERKRHDFNQTRGDSWRQKLTCAYQTNLKNLILWTRHKQKFFSFPAWWSLKVSKHINDDQRVDRELCTEECRKRRLLPSITSRFWTHALQHGNLERHEVLKDRRSRAMPNMPHTSKTRRDILYMWEYVTRHCRGGQEADRATNQHVTHHVRPGIHKLAWKSAQQGSTLCKLCRITKTQESNR